MENKNMWKCEKCGKNNAANKLYCSCGTIKNEGGQSKQNKSGIFCGIKKAIIILMTIATIIALYTSLITIVTDTLVIKRIEFLYPEKSAYYINYGLKGFISPEVSDYRFGCDILFYVVLPFCLIFWCVGFTSYQDLSLLFAMLWYAIILGAFYLLAWFLSVKLILILAGIGFLCYLIYRKIFSNESSSDTVNHSYSSSNIENEYASPKEEKVDLQDVVWKLQAGIELNYDEREAFDQACIEGKISNGDKSSILYNMQKRKEYDPNYVYRNEEIEISKEVDLTGRGVYDQFRNEEGRTPYDND